MCDNSSKMPSTPGEQELGSSSSNMAAEPSEATAATSTILARSGQHFRTEAAVKSNSETETLQKLNSKHCEFALFPASSQNCSQVPARSPRTRQRDSLVRIRKPCWSSALRSRRSRTPRRFRRSWRFRRSRRSRRSWIQVYHRQVNKTVFMLIKPSQEHMDPLI